MTRRRESWWIDGLYRDESDYYRYDGEIDGATFSAALMGVGRNDGPALLYDLYSAGSLSIYEHPRGSRGSVVHGGVSDQPNA